MNRCQLQRSNLALFPIDRPPGVVRRFYDEDRSLSVLRLLEPTTGHFQRIFCRVFHTEEWECIIFLERRAPLQHDIFGDLWISAGWWLVREVPIDRNDIVTRSTPLNGAGDDVS